jgi:hypothetical protein
VVFDLTGISKAAKTDPWRFGIGEHHGFSDRLAGGFRRAASAIVANNESANQARRLLALAEIYDGGSRSAAARIGGVGLQIVRDWVIRSMPVVPMTSGWQGARPPFAAERRSAPRWQRPDPGDPRVVRWRLIDLAQWLHDEFAACSTRPTSAAS